MLFLTLSDEDGLVEVVMMPDMYRRFRRVLNECDGKAIIAEGVVEKERDALTLQTFSLSQYHSCRSDGERTAAQATKSPLCTHG